MTVFLFAVARFGLESDRGCRNGEFLPFEIYDFAFDEQCISRILRKLDAFFGEMEIKSVFYVIFIIKWESVWVYSDDTLIRTPILREKVDSV